MRPSKDYETKKKTRIASFTGSGNTSALPRFRSVRDGMAWLVEGPTMLLHGASGHPGLTLAAYKRE